MTLIQSLHRAYCVAYHSPLKTERHKMISSEDDLPPAPTRLRWQDVENNAIELQSYVELRASGFPPRLAAFTFRVINGIHESWLLQPNIGFEAFLLSVETMCRTRIMETVESKPISQLWSLNKSIFHLLTILDQSGVSGDTKINAINALNNLIAEEPLHPKLQAHVAAMLDRFRKSPH
jgi:hypothetical protein